MSRPPRLGREQEPLGARVVGAHGDRGPYRTFGDAMTADQLEAAVLDLATAHGWRTLVLGDWLVLARRGAAAIVAVRGEGDRLTPHERALLGELRRAPGVTAEAWRPSDLGAIRYYLARPDHGGTSPW